MEMITACYTDAGNVKEVNQDSLSIKVVDSPVGKIVFAIVCDGMGGLEHGEIASKEVVLAFHQWFETQFAQLIVKGEYSQESIWQQWNILIQKMNHLIGSYAAKQECMMGTTASVLLILEGRYYLCHVGDSRIYRITQHVEQLTEDHTLVAQEVEMGKLTEEEAMLDPRRSVLLQCVGASDVVEPQFEAGQVEENTTFLLSSDGFVHMISQEELYELFLPSGIKTKEQLLHVCRNAVSTVMERGERDNITVIAVVCKENA